VQIVSTSIKQDFETESLTSLEQVFAQYGISQRLAKEIEKVWDDPDDIIDIGGGEKTFSYQRVLEKGKEHFVEIVNKAWEVKKRKSDPSPYIEQFWNAMLKASQDDSALFG
jgi:hypothetical protein